MSKKKTKKKIITGTLIIIILLLTINTSQAGNFDELYTKISDTPAGETLNLTENYTDTEGVHIYIWQDITIDGKGYTINFNQKENCIHIEPSCTVVLKNIILINSTTKEGAIYNNGNLILENTTFNYNHANSTGGAIFNDGNLNITGSTFNYNHANSTGGAIFNDGNLTINNSTFTNNTADHGGGAICNGGNLNINNSTFTNNTADHGGGAIANYEGDLTINNSTFNQNTAEMGGAIDNINGNLTINNSTFTNNNATYSGGAINNYEGDLNVSQSVLTDNTGIRTIHTDGGGVVVADGNYWGNNTPDFTSLVNFEIGDYYRFSLGNNTNTSVGSEISIDLLPRLNTTEAATWTGPTLSISDITFTSNPDTATLTPIDNTVKFNTSTGGLYNLTATTPSGVNSTIVIRVNDLHNTILTVFVNSTTVNGTLMDSTLNTPISNVTVTISINGVNHTVETDINGVYSYNHNINKYCNYPVIVTFNNTNYNSSSASGALNISLAENITANPVTSVYKDNVTFNGLFTSNNVTLGENIIVEIGNTIVATSTVNTTSGSVSFTINSIYNVGLYTLKFYHNNQLLNTTTWTVTQVPTSITILPIPSTLKQGNTLNIVVSLKAGTKPFSGQKVSTVYKGKTYTGKLTGTDGKSTITITNIAAGTYTFTIKYNGDSSYGASSKNANKLTVTKPVTVLKITSTSPRNGQKGYSRTRTIVITFNQKIKKSSKYARIYMKNLKNKRRVGITTKIVGNKLYIKMRAKRYKRTYYQIYIPRYAVINSAKKTISNARYVKFRT